MSFLRLSDLLEECPTRNKHALRPLKFPSIFDEYKKALACFWTVEEVDLGQDLVCFEKMTDDEKHFILKILSFFATAEGIVNENLATNFVTEIKIPEMVAFYQFQMAMEGIHHDMYGILLETYEKDKQKLEDLTNGVEKDASIHAKANWAKRWMSEGQPFLQRLIAFACVEGIFFSASFCAIFWLKKQGKMPGLTFSNELISRDEGMHRDFALYIYNCVHENVDHDTINEIVHSAVECELLFVDSALKDRSILGMNDDMMKKYVKHVANHLLHTIHLPPLYSDAEQPFEWMNLISMSGKTNFFEKRVGDYQKAGVMQSKEERGFALDDDF